MRVIALRIDQTNLKIGLRQPLEQPNHDGGLSAGRWPGDHEAGVKRIDGDFGSFGRCSQENRLAHEPVLHSAEIVHEKPINNFFDAFAVGRAAGEVGPLSECFNGIGNGDSTFPRVEQGMIVFSVAHRDGIVMGKTYLGKRGEQACTFIDSRRQNHDRALVVGDLEFQTEVANDGKNFGVLGLPRIHNDQAPP